MKIGDVYYEKHTVIETNGRSTECDVKKVNAIEIPENATNGDVIKVMFPNGKVIECDEAVGYEQMLDDKYSYCSWFDGLWWNAPYRKEGK